ncbi:MAG: HEAT repeat domain-containing protein [Deltaproteobacteria bacterium]|nr:HEAT repeat domain-containing protein [Deltaproteobacteria bacterium]
MPREEHRCFSFVIKSALVTLPFLLLLLFIPYARSDNVDELIRALNEPGEACIAAEGLAKLKTARAIEPLVDTAKHQKDRRVWRCAAEALAEIGDDKAVELLISSLRDENLSIARRSAYTLGIIKDTAAVGPLLHALTESHIPCPAAEALGAIKCTSSIEPLIDALNHEDRSVRSCAVIALGMIGDPRACKPLIKASMHDSDRITQGRATKALEMIDCSFKEHAQEYRIENHLCNMGQRMVDLMFSHVEQGANGKGLAESPEWKSFFSEFMAEQERLASSDPETGKKLAEVYLLVGDWTGSVRTLQELKRSSNKKHYEEIRNHHVERLREKQTRLRVVCPGLEFPDYPEVGKVRK